MVVQRETKLRNKVIQFTVSREAKDGWMSDLVSILSLNGNYLLGIMGECGSEMSYIRFITESPDEVRALLTVQGVYFCEREVIVVHLRNLENLEGIFRCLKNGEVSVLYAYGLIINAESKAGIVLMVDDVVMGIEILNQSGYEIMGQNDLSR
ncbi:MAG: hypothetical protein LBB11_02760 [Puniceicoccales bacterium]|jgi:hypothetical protein|nr:hypothetical protein [Puniceicoccales bacterium]